MILPGMETCILPGSARRVAVRRVDSPIIFCRIHDALNDCFADQAGALKLRRRGPAPALDDREVLTMEAVGSFLGLAEDTAPFAHFRCRGLDLLPALGHVSRTRFSRQAANPPACGGSRRRSGSAWRGRRRTTPPSR